MNKRKKWSGFNTEASHSTGRFMSVLLLEKPFNVTIIQVYAPATEAEEEEIESFYTGIQEKPDHTPKEDMLIIIGDWSAKVGSKTESDVIGKFVLRVRNEAGDWLMDFCEANSWLPPTHASND